MFRLNPYCQPFSEGKFEERFLGFTQVSSERTTAQLSVILSDTTHQFQCSEKIISQTYYGAPVMSGSINGLQTLVKEKYLETEVLFVHCYGHRLNLVFKNSIDSKKVCKVFF